jgi:hypothetical protein
VAHRKATLSFLIFLAITATGVIWPGAVPAGTHSAVTKIRAPYPDSARGLKQELQDMRDLARKRRLAKLQSMVTDFDIPDARTWYLANFGESGPETADSYEKNLAASKQRFEEQMIAFAHEDGYFSVKKQDPKEVYRDLVTAPEVFLAAWEHISTYGEDPFEMPIGYFFFIDGKFRLDSTITWVTVD